MHLNMIEFLKFKLNLKSLIVTLKNMINLVDKKIKLI